jgi:hypothetical protein
MTLVFRRVGCGYSVESAAERPFDDELHDLIWVGAECAPRVGQRGGGGL